MSSLPPSAPDSTPPVDPLDTQATTGTSARSCPNCGAPLHGAFCSSCGQRDEPVRQRLDRYLRDAIAEFFGIDGRVWTSLKLLLFRPGRLTQAYIVGRRVRYLRPLRLYLVASLLFFFLLSVIDPAAQVDLRHDAAAPDSTLRAADYRAAIDSMLVGHTQRVAMQVALVDSLAALASGSLTTTPTRASLATASAIATAARQQTGSLEDVRDELESERDDLDDLREDLERSDRRLRWMRRQLAHAPADSLVRPADYERAAELLIEPSRGRVDINLPSWIPQSDAVRQLRAARTGQEMRSALAAFIRDVLRHLPTVMFILLPVFAVLLKLLYIRRGWYYSEHLVFGLHTHAFAFCTFLLMLLLAWGADGATWARVLQNVLLFIGIPAYFFVAQKRVYGQGWLKTALKAWLLGWMYMFVLSMGAVLAVLLAAAV